MKTDGVHATVQTIFIALGVSFLSATSGKAASLQFCTAYTQNALIHFQTNVRFRCGAAGPEWSTDGRGHLNWCLRALQDSGEKGERSRLGRLAGCSKEAVCTAYAKTAFQVNRQRARLRCHLDLRSPARRWHSHEPSHFGWCMSTPQEWIESESITRLQSINACEKCAPYAQLAVLHDTINKNRGCRLSGDPWNGDWHGHYDWCVQSDNWELNRGHNGRRAALRSCGVASPP